MKACASQDGSQSAVALGERQLLQQWGQFDKLEPQ
jgi:hypothetical protein